MHLDMLGRDEARDEAARRAAALASEVLAGSVGLIEGARTLWRLGSYIVQDTALDKDFVVLVGFDDETDHLPVGAERSNWDPVALMGKDREIAEYEEMWGPKVRAACQSIVARFGAA